jgi:ABC-2 type transport system ATP-binding protein
MIEIEHLRKVFKRNAGGDPLWRRVLGRTRSVPLVAVDDVSLIVPEGGFCSLLGSNGAGKTTTMKILSTLLLPDAGSARVAGFDVVREEEQVREHIGVSIRGERSVYWRLTGRQNFEYFASLVGLRGEERRRRVGEVAELVGLADRLDDYVERYSMGMKQRLALGCALLHRPRVLLLDEPTIGLDPHSARALRAFVRDDLCKQNGVTVLYTTHYMHEAEELSDKVAILFEGRIVAEGTPEAVCRSLQRQDVLEVRARGVCAPALAALRSHSAVASVAADVDADDVATLHVTLRPNAPPIGAFADLLAERGAEVRSVGLVRPTLEDAFVALTGTSIEQSGQARAVGRD